MPDEPMEGEIEPRSLAETRSMRTPSEQVVGVGNLLQMAIQSGIGADQLERLVALQEHVYAKQAKDEFYAAMAGFHAECPVIGKNRTAKVRSRKGEESSYSYGYADLAMVAETIRPLCEKYGFSYSFQQKFEKGIVETVCIVRHEGGHQESTTFTGPSENESGQSAMQKVIGATTSARRLALVLAFGLSIGEDNDGRGFLPEAHPNAERRTDAPRTPPRGQRQQPTNFAVTKDELQRLVIAWDEQNPDTEGDLEAYARWVMRQTGMAHFAEVPPGGKSLGAFALRLWTRDDLDVCYRALGLGGE